ncbi:hypothetical protein [Amycolatopsis sp. NPDC051071]|uniref:hypothetical protein n=1 Tax=Amycolatopsis sp. NPDC051071 TaxID=3154637 RepID=UPI00343E2AB5
MARDLSGLHPVTDLWVEGNESPEQVERRQKATLAVAALAKNAEDCALLLDMLGLHDSGRSSEVA